MQRIDFIQIGQKSIGIINAFFFVAQLRDNQKN